VIYKFGKYPRWYTTWNLESKWLSFRYGDTAAIDFPEEKYDKLDSIVIGILDSVQFVLNKTINPLNEFRGQKIRVYVEDHDIYSADYTIACMALPILEKLRDEKHGYPMIEPDDIEGMPEELKPTKEELQEYSENYTPDSLAEARWNWVLNEVIFAMECITDDSWEDEFFAWEDPNNMMSLKMIDKEGYDAKQERINRGFRLFGQFYRALWD